MVMQSSSHAQGYLRALTKLLQGEDRKSSLESVNFSPTRFVSHAGPASTLVKSFPEVVQYLTHLKLEGDQGQRVWCHTLQALDLKLWVVLAGIADLLGILKSANIATQRKNLWILEVAAIVETVKGSLAECIRAGTGQFAEALKLLFQQTDARPNAKSHVEIFCSSVHVTRLSPGNYRCSG